MPNTFSRKHRPESDQPQEDDGSLCGFADRIHFAAPRQNGLLAFEKQAWMTVFAT
jgi:hypothetical protein